MKTCPECNGEGIVDRGTDDEKRCPNCAGLGVVADDDDDRGGGEPLRTRSSSSEQTAR